jgi:hypothetical protein
MNFDSQGVRINYFYIYENWHFENWLIKKKKNLIP